MVKGFRAVSISKYLIRNIHFQEDCDLVGAIMDMSSYQFVNTLAQCYEANAQLQGGAVPGGESSKVIYPNQNVIVFLLQQEACRGVGLTTMGCSTRAATAPPPRVTPPPPPLARPQWPPRGPILGP